MSSEFIMKTPLSPMIGSFAFDTTLLISVRPGGARATPIFALSLHGALPISGQPGRELAEPVLASSGRRDGRPRGRLVRPVAGAVRDPATGRTRRPQIGRAHV